MRELQEAGVLEEGVELAKVVDTPNHSRVPAHNQNAGHPGLPVSRLMALSPLGLNASAGKQRVTADVNSPCFPAQSASALNLA